MSNIFLGIALVLLALLGRYHVSYTVALAAAAMPLYLVRLSFVSIPTNFFELIVVAIAIGTVSQRQWWQRVVLALRALPVPVRVFVVAWLLAAGVSTYISDEPRVSLGILKGWILIPLLLGALVYIAGPMAHRRVLHALIFSGGVSASWALLRVTSYELRVTGFYDVPNSLALWLVPLLVLAVWQRTRLATIAAAVMALALLCTQSVAGIVTTLVTLCVGSVLFLEGPQRRRAIMLIVITMVAAASYLSLTGRLIYLASPWVTGAPNSISVRVQLWRVGLDLISDNPWLGIGLGQFEPAYQATLHERFLEYERGRDGKTPGVWDPLTPGVEETRPLREFVFRDPHNWILSMWLNMGLLGLVAFVGLHLYLLWRILFLQPTPYNLQPVLLALLSLLLFGLADTIYWKNDLAALQWALLATMVTATTPTANQREKVGSLKNWFPPMV